MVFKVKKLRCEAILPTRSTAGSAGWDLYACSEGIVLPNCMQIIKTGLQIRVPEGTYGRVAPRSGLSLKGIFINAGVIDSDYRGEVGIVIYNFSDAPFSYLSGHRLAQLIIEKIDVSEIEEIYEDDETERGSGGFGSSGV